MWSLFKTSLKLSIISWFLSIIVSMSNQHTATTATTKKIHQSSTVGMNWSALRRQTSRESRRTWVQISRTSIVSEANCRIRLLHSTVWGQTATIRCMTWAESILTTTYPHYLRRWLWTTTGWWIWILIIMPRQDIPTGTSRARAVQNRCWITDNQFCLQGQTFHTESRSWCFRANWHWTIPKISGQTIRHYTI